MTNGKYVVIKMEADDQNKNITSVADAINYLAKQVDDPVLYTQSISFKGGECTIIWERAPDELHNDLKRIYKR